MAGSIWGGGPATLEKALGGMARGALPNRRPGHKFGGVKTITVQLPEPVAKWLELRAKETKRTRSAVVREALERERSGKDHPRSCRDLLAGLEGYFDGPPDLSTNPKHMEGFGQ